MVVRGCLLNRWPSWWPEIGADLYNPMRSRMLQHGLEAAERGSDTGVEFRMAMFGDMAEHAPGELEGFEKWLLDWNMLPIIS